MKGLSKIRSLNQYAGLLCLICFFKGFTFNVQDTIFKFSIARAVNSEIKVKSSTSC